MHFLILPLITVAADVDPSPVPSLQGGVSTDQVSPGFLGFLATFFVVAIMVFLIVDMVRRIRRVRYRAQVAGELESPALPGAEEPGQNDPADPERS